jgi:hypothetical protein
VLRAIVTSPFLYGSSYPSGFAGLSAKQLHAATRLLGACLTDAAER